MAGLLGLSLGLGLGLGSTPTATPAPGPASTTALASLSSPTTAAAVLINQDPVNLGPLTEVFTAPPECTVAAAECKTCSNAWLGQTCNGQSAIDAAACWPPTSSGAPSPSASFHGWGFYSPGIACPAGSTTACSATGGPGGGSGWTVQFRLRDGETAVGCCPSGYACANIGGQTCVSVATSTTVPTVACQAGSGALSGALTIPNAAASVTALSLFAPMIQINFQSSDLTASSTAAETATVSLSIINMPTGASPDASNALQESDGLVTATGQPSPTLGFGQSSPTSSTTADSSSSSSPSTPIGAVVGVGVAGGLGFLAVLVGGCWMFQRRIRRKRDVQDAALQRLDSMYEASKPQELGGGGFSRYPFQPGVGRGGSTDYRLRAAMPTRPPPVELGGEAPVRPY